MEWANFSRRSSTGHLNLPLANRDHHLIDYLVSGVTGGTDALAEVTVKLGNGHNVFTGRASALDIVAASARAYLQAINKLVYYAQNRSATTRVGAHA